MLIAGIGLHINTNYSETNELKANFESNKFDFIEANRTQTLLNFFELRFDRTEL
jgi:hypothetical protein